MEELNRGDIVKLKPNACEGWGNEQCISNVCEPLNQISLFGHNQHIRTGDIDKVIQSRTAPIDVKEQILHDYSIYGVHITQDGKRIDPKDYYKPNIDVEEVVGEYDKRIFKTIAYDIARETKKDFRLLMLNQLRSNTEEFIRTTLTKLGNVEDLNKQIEAYKEICEKYIPEDKMDEANSEIISICKGVEEKMGRDLLRRQT